ncbi:MAG TPA: isocitrate lyase/phosphoenolpyruvate mutase family protein [Rhizomicrobium sp.]|jgi:2-methylisocitrate lyase-like PEP mutase family enzyme|nr:isocitrate lyase/phosphoenolpyruvate mutase family protein [Rhizomicrobium sp.]
MSSQKENFETFRSLHGPGKFLVLPNGWDAASARMAQEAGAQAIATSSAALAWCHGYADGETMPREVVMTATREVLRVVNLPVTVDSEAGYSADPAKVAEHVMLLIDLGVAGINLEDGQDAPELVVSKIKAIKAAAKAKGTDIFINARADVYLANLVPDDAKLAELIRRGKLYAQAGADGFFAPAMTNIEDIGKVVREVDLPLNILLMRATPPLAQMKEAGVRRISAGALIGRAAYGKAVRAVKMLLDEGEGGAIFETSNDCPDFNKWFGA